MCPIIHAKLTSFLPDFHQTLIFSKGYRKILKYQISWKSVQWEPSYSTWKDMTQLTVAFRTFSYTLNPLTPELNLSAQRCLPRYFTGILIFKGLTALRLHKSSGFTGLKIKYQHVRHLKSTLLWPQSNISGFHKEKAQMTTTSVTSCSELPSAFYAVLYNKMFVRGADVYATSIFRLTDGY
jgi:hypothetical protein